MRRWITRTRTHTEKSAAGPIKRHGGLYVFSRQAELNTINRTHAEAEMLLLWLDFFLK